MVLKGITTQKICRGQQALQLNKKLTRNEFQRIINYTDQDEEHKKKKHILDPLICRYKDVYPYQHNVIKIPNNHQFVNASFMHIEFRKSFIASQGPNDNTVDDFWQMCFQYKVTRILMLCNEIEDNKKKCSNYWDNNMKSQIFKNIKTEILFQNNSLERKIITIQNTANNEVRQFPHMQFKEWPDHSTPNIQNYVKLFRELFNFVDERYNDKVTENDPVLVHCSAGIGRTGVFLTLYAICKEINKQIENGSSDVIIFNVFNFVRKLKEMRMFSVENINQYNFLYKFLEEYLIENNLPNQGNQIIN